MGIYIPNVEKPKKCSQCPCAYFMFTKGEFINVCQLTGDDIDDMGKLLKSCPIKEMHNILYKAFLEYSKPFLKGE